MKNSNWRFFRKIFMFFCLIVFIFGSLVLYGFRLEPIKKEVKTKTEIFTNTIAEIPVDSTTKVDKTAQDNPNVGTIEITKSGLLSGDHAKLSLYYMDGSTKTYISPSPQTVADGGKATWTGLDLGKTYYVEEDFNKIENIHTYNVTNPVAEIPVDSTAKEERTVQNIPNPIAETPVESITNEEKIPKDTLEEGTTTGEQVHGETYVIIHGSTIIERMTANPGGNAAISSFTWYILLTIKEEIISSESGYILNPTIYRPITFSPIMTTVSFFLKHNKPGSDTSTATAESIRVLEFTYMNSIILLSAGSAVIGALAMLIASSRRRRYKRWKHAYGTNRNFNQDENNVRLAPAKYTLETVYGVVKPLKKPEDFKKLKQIAIKEHVEKIIEEMEK
jgi:hypothetical protein